jgi:hypothetical protein
MDPEPMAQTDFAAANELTRLLRQRKDALTIRWLAITVAIGVFGLVLAVLAQHPHDPIAPALTIASWVVVVGLAVASIVLPHKQLTDKHVVKHLGLPADPQRLARQLKLDAEQARVLGALPDLEQRLFALTALFERPYTLALALTGGVALVGLGYGLVTRTMVEAMPLLLSALVLNCWHFPRFGRLVERGRKLEDVADEARTVRELTRMQKSGARKRTSDRPPGSPERSIPSRKP